MLSNSLFIYDLTIGGRFLIASIVYRVHTQLRPSDANFLLWRSALERGICGRQSGTEIQFYRSTTVLPCRYHSVIVVTRAM